MTETPQKSLDWVKTGGMTPEELSIFNLLNYDILADANYQPYQFRLTNAIHLLQHVLMWRVIIRLNEGQFWTRFNQPYDNNSVLSIPPHSQQYADFIQGLMLFYMGVQGLDPYHPSMLDDARRGINEIFEIIALVETQNLTVT
jgi:hypothetical protein